MADWVPLFQTLVWPVFIILAFLIFRKPAKKLIHVITERIHKGADFSIGPQGVTVGSAPKLEQPKENLAKKEVNELNYEELQEIFYISHTAQFARILDDGKEDYSVTVWIDSGYDYLFERITKVVYHLHSSYYPRDRRESVSRMQNFELKFYAWGQFNLNAEVFLKDRENPIILWRYINF
ncbi:MAG: hypothetical protein H6696_06480 [Deferribacteres bacterium]|nr:hypothetical protein [candidate division KSB1 bacterium]MCB9501566.1 hypothetical protein [Deferribacteres bacterium]